MPEYQSKSSALLEIYVVFGESCGFFGEEVGVEKKKGKGESFHTLHSIISYSFKNLSWLKRKYI